MSVYAISRAINRFHSDRWFALWVNGLSRSSVFLAFPLSFFTALLFARKAAAPVTETVTPWCLPCFWSSLRSSGTVVSLWRDTWPVDVPLVKYCRVTFPSQLVTFCLYKSIIHNSRKQRSTVMTKDLRPCSVKMKCFICYWTAALAHPKKTMTKMSTFSGGCVCSVRVCDIVFCNR